MKHRIISLLTLFLCFAVFPAIAQRSRLATPPGILYGAAPLQPADRMVLATPDLKAIELQDNLNPTPYRYAVLLPAAITTERQGRWDEVPGGRIWRTEISSHGALALAAYFDLFELRPGEQLFLYAPDRSVVLGAFTEQNNRPERTFATSLLPGDRMLVEFFQPDGIRGLPAIRINEVAYAYRGVSDPVSNRSAGNCEVNIVCPEGQNWQEVKQGVVRISIKKLGALYWCTGSLVNNTRQDKTPYLLTADHCGTPATTSDLTQWVFYFRYEAPSCDYHAFVSANKSLTGAKVKAHGGDSGDDGSDFYLVVLTESIPDSFDVYMSGWSREDTAAGHGVSIHHPQGDVKKISTYTTPLQTSTYMGGPVLSHWKVTWSPTASGWGVTEGGSSGSPIYNEEGLIVGTLTGGFSMCDSASLDSPDFYGKFSYSWNSNGTDSAKRLDCWLDPDQTGQTKLPGIPLSVQTLPGGLPLQAWPNPFTDAIRISVPAGDREVRVMLYDLPGALRFTATIPRKSNVPQVLSPDLPPGLYILTVTDGERSSSIKVMKLKQE